MITDPSGAVSLLREMVGLRSFSGSERELATWLVRRLTGAGLRSWLDEAGNVHAVAGSEDGPELMLLGHLDTVPGEVPVRVEGDVLHGRGAVDAKGPLAAFLCAAARLDGRIPARVHVVGAVDEERTSTGARHLVRSMPAPDAVVIGEPSGADAVGVGYKGMLRYRLDVRRPSAHTSSPDATAAEVAAAHWARACDWLDLAYSGTSARFDQASLALVRIEGDLETAELEVSCRVPPDFDVERFAGLLREWAPGDRVTVHESVPAVRSSRTDPVVRALSAAIRGGGFRPGTKLKLGTSDWNVVGPVWDVPVAAYGPGDSKLCHTPEEHLSLTEYLRAVDVLTEALPRLAGALRPVVTAGAGRRATP
ncbi:[LysW]-lysine hydrolase [Amycolatopsis sp. NPDC047767]|uniref:[LysW]-lysine hydrolase n=1 Tax=Amycolatopsis sp. NPDC047767 TaxID=3156765 RepID=UPI003456C358